MMQGMKPYSEDLRRSIVLAVEGEISKSAAARLFGVSLSSLSSVKRYLRIAQRGVSLAPKKGGGRPPKTDQTAEKLLEEDVKERPAATVSERRRFLEHATGKALSDSTIKRLLKRLWLQLKKRTVGAHERDEWLRAAWRATVAQEIAAERLVFVDEMGTNTSSVHPLYAWSPRGERAHCCVPRNRGSNTTTLLASMRRSRVWARA
jgi:transposase